MKTYLKKNSIIIIQKKKSFENFEFFSNFEGGVQKSAKIIVFEQKSGEIDKNTFIAQNPYSRAIIIL